MVSKKPYQNTLKLATNTQQKLSLPQRKSKPCFGLATENPATLKQPLTPLHRQPLNESVYLLWFNFILGLRWSVIIQVNLAVRKFWS